MNEPQATTARGRNTPPTPERQKMLRTAAEAFHVKYQNDPRLYALMGEGYVSLGRSLYTHITSLLDALKDAEGERDQALRLASEHPETIVQDAAQFMAQYVEAKGRQGAAEAELATARTDTLLLMWHADAHSEPDCKRCAEWFDVVLPAAMDTAGRARAALSLALARARRDDK